MNSRHDNICSIKEAQDKKYALQAFLNRLTSSRVKFGCIQIKAWTVTTVWLWGGGGVPLFNHIRGTIVWHEAVELTGWWQTWLDATVWRKLLWPRTFIFADVGCVSQFNQAYIGQVSLHATRTCHTQRSTCECFSWLGVCSGYFGEKNNNIE